MAMMLLRKIRRNEKIKNKAQIPIIAMTANAFSEDIQNSLNAGMDAHVSKPVDMKTLIKTVHSIQSGVWGGKTFGANDTWLSFGQIVQK